eukprot:3306705-Pyramimonas_sp.AAC.1
METGMGMGIGLTLPTRGTPFWALPGGAPRGGGSGRPPLVFLGRACPPTGGFWMKTKRKSHNKPILKHTQ